MKQFSEPKTTEGKIGQSQPRLNKHGHNLLLGISLHMKHWTEMPNVSWGIAIQRILQNDWSRPIPSKTWETG